MSHMQTLTPTMEHYTEDQHDEMHLHRLLPRFRVGVISGEVFEREARNRLPVDFDAGEPLPVQRVATKMKKATDDAADRRAKQRKAPVDSVVAAARARKRASS